MKTVALYEADKKPITGKNNLEKISKDFSKAPLLWFNAKHRAKCPIGFTKHIHGYWK